MDIDPRVFDLLNTLLIVILITLIISAGPILLTLEMYGYERYKKWKDREVKERDKILVGRAKQITKADEELQRQSEEKRRLDLDVELLQTKKKALQSELGEDDIEEKENDPKEIDLDSMNIRDLKKLAKQRNMKMYSKKSKAQLLEMLKAN